MEICTGKVHRHRQKHAAAAAVAAAARPSRPPLSLPSGSRSSWPPDWLDVRLVDFLFPPQQTTPRVCLGFSAAQPQHLYFPIATRGSAVLFVLSRRRSTRLTLPAPIRYNSSLRPWTCRAVGTSRTKPVCARTVGPVDRLYRPATRRGLPWPRDPSGSSDLCLTGAREALFRTSDRTDGLLTTPFATSPK